MTYNVDVEIAVPKWLREALSASWPGLLIGRREPANAPARMVLVRRQGGGSTYVTFDRPRLGISVWAPTDLEANRLAGAVVTALRGCETQGRISSLSITGPSDVADTETDVPRRFMSVDFLIRTTEEPS